MRKTYPIMLFHFHFLLLLNIYETEMRMNFHRDLLSSLERTTLFQSASSQLICKHNSTFHKELVFNLMYHDNPEHHTNMESFHLPMEICSRR